METDSKFGNIDLYLWQVRHDTAENMRYIGGHDLLFISYEYFVRRAFTHMLNFLLRRFRKEEDRQMVTYDDLCRALSDHGLEFTAYSAWYNVRKASGVKFSGIDVIFSNSGESAVVSVHLSFCTQPLELHKSGFMVRREDLMECLLMVETLGGRISGMVREEYAARLAKNRANRVKRTAARHCRQ